MPAPLQRSWRPRVVAVTAALLTALAGGLATDIGPWYRALVKPSWQPPDWLFGPVWTLIFALSATAAILLWERLPDPADRRRTLQLFALNIALNVGWSLLFFTLHRPDWALVEVALLWASVALLVLHGWRRARLASVLLLPYLAWVAFAAYLNLTIVRLNGPFGG